MNRISPPPPSTHQLLSYLFQYSIPILNWFEKLVILLVVSLFILLSDWNIGEEVLVGSRLNTSFDSIIIGSFLLLSLLFSLLLLLLLLFGWILRIKYFPTSSSFGVYIFLQSLDNSFPSESDQIKRVSLKKRWAKSQN
jgi:hypothetical protein